MARVETLVLFLVLILFQLEGVAAFEGLVDPVRVVYDEGERHLDELTHWSYVYTEGNTFRGLRLLLQLQVFFPLLDLARRNQPLFV